MIQFSFNAADLAWPIGIALAWVVGEFMYRWTKLPRISVYGLIGFLLANSQIGFLSHLDSSTVPLLADIAFALILFEFGYRINLHWLRHNPWIGVIGVLEAAATFVAVYWVAQWFGTPALTSLLLAALAMATSPAGLMRVINEKRSSGQVTERVLHLAAINCVMAVFAFNVIVVFSVFQATGNFFQASTDSLILMVASASLGAIFGVLLPAILRMLSNTAQDATVAFAIAVILLVALTHAAKLSPIIAALTFGLMARHRRLTLSKTQRNFGALGDLLTIMLFLFATSTLEWQRVVAGAGLGAALIAVRLVAKIAINTLFARLSGITFRKGFLTGLGLTPVSIFVILTLENTRYIGINLLEDLAPLVAMTMMLEIFGPIITQRALIWANEAPDNTEK